MAGSFTDLSPGTRPWSRRWAQSVDMSSRGRATASLMTSTRALGDGRVGGRRHHGRARVPSPPQELRQILRSIERQRPRRVPRGVLDDLVRGVLAAGRLEALAGPLPEAGWERPESESDLFGSRTDAHNRSGMTAGSSALTMEPSAAADGDDGPPPFSYRLGRRLKNWGGAVRLPAGAGGGDDGGGCDETAETEPPDGGAGPRPDRYAAGDGPRRTVNFYGRKGSAGSGHDDSFADLLEDDGAAARAASTLGHRPRRKGPGEASAAGHPAPSRSFVDGATIASAVASITDD
ncbi:hypothetical protein THAOC_04790, partial [Thalassiosira oceanica]